MKTENKKVRLYVKHTTVKKEDGTFNRKTSHFIEVNGMLRPVYMRTNVKNVGYVVPLNIEAFNAFFQFEVPDYSGSSNTELGGNQ
jgi:hypothetical protein